MLTKLEIQNYILIDHLSIDLSNQLSVITGETGAGKSIIMGALGLILGDRADSTVCREASKKCFIEGIFKLNDAKIHSSFFEENEIELKQGCEVILKKQTNDTFIGQTGEKTCPSELRGASYASSKVTVTPTQILSWDQGFDKDGKQVWGAVKGGYIFDKIKN